MNPYGIQPEDLSSILKILESDEMVHEIVLFGSRAKGNFSSGSDIDLALKGNKLTLNNLITLSTKLDELFLPYQCDLVIFDRIQEPKLTEHIERVGKLLFKRNQSVFLFLISGGLWCN